MDRTKLERIIAEGVDFDIKTTLEKGWDLFKKGAPLHVGFTFLIIMIQLTFTVYLEDFLFIFTIFLAPALVTGFYLAGNRMSQDDSVEFKDFFDGFKYWMPVVLINLISSLLVVFGIFALVLPGVYLLVGYMFCILFGVFGGFDFWTSMELSRRLIQTQWWRFFGLGVVLFLINMAGALTLGVGLLISIPLTYLSIYGLFEDLTSQAAEDSTE